MVSARVSHHVRVQGLVVMCGGRPSRAVGDVGHVPAAAGGGVVCGLRSVGRPAGRICIPPGGWRRHSVEWMCVAAPKDAGHALCERLVGALEHVWCHVCASVRQWP